MHISTAKFSATRYKKFVQSLSKNTSMYTMSGPLQPGKGHVHSRQSPMLWYVYLSSGPLFLPAVNVTWSDSDRSAQPRTEKQPAEGNERKESQLRVVLNERRSDVAAVHVVAMADLEADSVRAATLKAHAALGRTDLTKYAALADVPHVPVPFIVRCKRHRTAFNWLAS